MWSILRAKRISGFKFRRQHALGRYIADFICLKARLAIEVDGDTHGTDESPTGMPSELSRSSRWATELSGFGTPKSSRHQTT
jgi:Protein of unknown function (DUF559)